MNAKTIGIGTVATLVVATLMAASVSADGGPSTYSCTTLVGGTPLLVNTAEGGLGGCVLLTTKEDLEVESIVGCEVEADTDGEVGNDAVFAEGDVIPSGSVVWAVCALGDVNLETTLTLVEPDN